MNNNSPQTATVIVVEKKRAGYKRQAFVPGIHIVVVVVVDGEQKKRYV